MHGRAYMQLVFLCLHRCIAFRCRRTKHESDTMPRMDEGRKRVIGIMAAILASMHVERADDLFGGPQGSPGRTS
jgi:hypothetical protein